MKTEMIAPEHTARAEWMFNVSVKRKHIDPVSKRVAWKFIPKKVKEVAKDEVYRCLHCGGKVRLHQGKKVEWHAKHLELREAQKCPGGMVVYVPKAPDKKLLRYD
jgi:DNA-directed RNA polymerase subunit RPC12/RpoP